MFDCLSLWAGMQGGGVTHYKAVLKLKPPLFFSPPTYLFFHQKLHGATEDHPELASICHDEGPGTFALPCLPLTPAPPPPPPLPPPPSSPYARRRRSRRAAKPPISPCMITAHSDLYSGESSSTSFGRRKASAPASFMPRYKSGMETQ